MERSTLRLRVDEDAPECPSLALAAKILRRGGTVAFPTETVYGLGANALDAGAVEKIFVAKQRPAWDPLIVHVADRAMLAQVVADVPEMARRLIDAFWPGPLTLLLPKSARIPGAVTAERRCVGVRMPAHPVARALIRTAAVPVAAPSANLFGRSSPTTAAHVLADLDGRIDAVIDGGPSAVGVESTVLDACEVPPLIYRPGGVTLEQIRVFAPDARIFQDAPASIGAAAEAAPASLPSPGLGMRHYAPRARLVLTESAPGFAAAVDAARAQTDGLIGVMQPAEFELPRGVHAFSWGSLSDPGTLAQRLFAGLRALDAAGVAVIVCPLPGADGLGAAVRDRLGKAARTE